MENKYNLNYESSEIQAMSAERASAYRVWKTVNEYLGGSTMFFSFCEQAKYTYEDFVSYIGCEATNYFFDAKNKARTYTWIAKDNETAKFSALFTQKPDEETWTLNFSGSTNLMTEPARPEDEADDGQTKAESTSADEINVDEILNGLKEELKIDFDSSEINASSIAGSLIALMGAGLFAAGLSTIGNADASKSAKGEADMTSSEPQKLTDEAATAEVLKKTHSEWLDGKYVFKGTAYELLTYENFKEQIGCEATVYYYDKIQNARVYTWIAQDDNTYSLCVWFKQKGEKWGLYLIPPQ